MLRKISKFMAGGQNPRTLDLFPSLQRWHRLFHKEQDLTILIGSADQVVSEKGLILEMVSSLEGYLLKTNGLWGRYLLLTSNQLVIIGIDPNVQLLLKTF